MIGTLGREIVFEVSDEKVLTFQAMSREVKGRWATHETISQKPKKEFLGPDSQTLELTITLSAALGVRPRQTLERIAEAVESGTAEYLVIGGKVISQNPFCLVAQSETWDKLYSGGELARATLTLSLEEYT